MAAILEKWLREELHRATRFLWAKHASPSEIRRKLIEVCDDGVRRVHVLKMVHSSKTAVHPWGRPHRTVPHITERHKCSKSEKGGFWKPTSQNSRFIHPTGIANRKCTNTVHKEMVHHGLYERPPYLPQRSIWTRTKMGKMQQCDWGLCRKSNDSSAK